MPAPVVHFEIGCRNITNTQKFYGTLFGWEFMAHGPSAMIGNLGPFAPKATEGIGGHLNSLGHEPHNYVTVYAQVDNIAATLQKVQSLGGKTCVPETEVPGMGWFAWFQDPEGNCVGLWKPMKK